MRVPTIKTKIHPRDVDPEIALDADICCDREQQLRRLSKQDKVKAITNRRIQMEQTTQKITQAKDQLAKDKAALEQLRSKRAKLTIDKKPTVEVDKQIAALTVEIENAPAVIEVLEQQLATEQQQHNHQIRDQLLNAQKEAAKEMERLSVKYVNALSKAVEINDSLHIASEKYINLQRKTKTNVCSPKVTQGSEGFLLFLHDICKQEIKGKRPNRPIFPQPCPRI
ncbi:MAG: hypothetical protein ACYS6K_16045 [Planctomycetota bacterium]|jgi:hypothetical protein